MWSRCRRLWTSSVPSEAMTDNIFVRYLAFPNTSVKAATYPNDDGSYDIYVNTLLSPAQQEKALQHELEHIRLGHFYSDSPIEQKEAEAEGLAPASEEKKRLVPVFESPGALADWLLRQ